MLAFQYCPNRSSRVLDVEIDMRQSPAGLWKADCTVYETVDGRRLLRGRGGHVTAPTEQACLDEAEARIAEDIEQGRGIAL